MENNQIENTENEIVRNITIDEINEMSMDELKNIEAMFCYSTNANLYSILHSLEILKTMRSAKLQTRHPKASVELLDFENSYSSKQIANGLGNLAYDNEVIGKDVVEIQSDFFKLFKGTGAESNMSRVDTVRIKSEFDKFVEIMNKFSEMLKMSVDSLQSVLKEKDDRASIEKMSTLNSRMGESLKDIIDKSKHFEITADCAAEFHLLDKLYREQGEFLYKILSNYNVEQIEEVVDSKENKEVEQKTATVLKPVEPTERELMVKKANDMYEMFCSDYLRDLEKQYSLSSKDLYQSFLTTYGKFMNEHNMPLSSKASMGQAKVVINQINKMIDMIPNISKNTYATTPFEK